MADAWIAPGDTFETPLGRLEVTREWTETAKTGDKVLGFTVVEKELLKKPPWTGMYAVKLSSTPPAPRMTTTATEL